MTIDLHDLLEKNPITKKLLQPKFGYKYLGPCNDLENQFSHNKNTGQIYRYYANQKIIWMKLQVDMIRVTVLVKIKTNAIELW